MRIKRDIGSLLVGIGIGSLVTLLLSPTTGEDLRYALDRRYRKVAKRIGRHGEALGDRAEDFVDRVQDLRERGSRILDRGRSGYGWRRWA